MALIPAYCKACDFVFTLNPGIQLGEGIDVTITGATTSNFGSACPKCGGEADIISGRVRTRDGLFEVISAPDMTERVLRRLGLLLLESVSANEGPEEAAKRIEQEAPALARWIRESFSGVARPVFLAAITGIAGGIAEGATLDVIGHLHPEAVINLTVNQSAMSPAEQQAAIQDIIRKLKQEERNNKGGGPRKHKRPHPR